MPYFLPFSSCLSKLAKQTGMLACLYAAALQYCKKFIKGPLTRKSGNWWSTTNLYRLFKLFLFLLFPNCWLVFSLVVVSWKNENRWTVYRRKNEVVSLSLNLHRCPELLLTFMPGIWYMLTWFFSRGNTNCPCSFACRVDLARE